MQHLVGRAQNSSCAADSSASVCVYVSILQVRPDLQAEEDEASRAMLKASIIFLANPCSLCTEYGRWVAKWPFIWRIQVVFVVLAKL